MDYLQNSDHDTSLSEYLVSAGHERNQLANRPAFRESVLTNCCNQIVNSLPPKILRLLEHDFRRVQVSKEDFLFHQDDELGYVYFPETAVVSEFHILDDGRMVEVSITGREGVIGMASLFHAGRTSNCVQVTQAGTLLRVESVILRKALRRNPELAPLLHVPLENYIRQISHKSVCNMYHSIDERLCTWLLMVQDRCGRAKLRLTHEQIARTLGVYRPSVTCIAIKLRKKRLIEYSRGRIQIVDRRGMENEACECYSELCLT